MKQLILASAATLALATQAFADNKETVSTLYEFFSNPSSAENAQAAEAVIADDWQSIGDYSGKTVSREAFIKDVQGIPNMIPDLNWEVVEMIDAGDKVIVRSRATGTPNDGFMGIDGEGRSFDIMAIDIHTLEDGKITTTYHLEDWSGAMGQLRGGE